MVGTLPTTSELKDIIPHESWVLWGYCICNSHILAIVLFILLRENPKKINATSQGIFFWRWLRTKDSVKKTLLTMRKHAPIMTALILTSRSMGNWIPKLSESVNASRRSPVHCLLIFPILLTSSIVKICRKCHREGRMLTCVALGWRSIPKLVWFYWREIMEQFIIPSNFSFLPAATVTWIFYPNNDFKAAMEEPWW